MTRLLAALLALSLTAATATPLAQSSTSAGPVFRSGTDLVLVNVVVRDGEGNVVRGLTADDFTITEDGKAQTVSSFDVEELDSAPAAPVAEPVPVLPARPTLSATAVAPAAPVIDMHGRRLIVLFLDLSSMQPEETERAVKAANQYVEQNLSPADLIAIASFSTALRVDQDFTADRDLLAAALGRFSGVTAEGLQEGATGDSDGTPDNGGAFVADDTEFNIFNTDRRLAAMQSLVDALAPIQQKKSVVYFSSGMNQSGQDNQVLLRRTIDRANRANVSFYAQDTRGLQALAAGGDATQASTRGLSAFTGGSTQNQFARLASSQDTLTTLAEDTGGRAFFDSNNFADVFRRVVADTSAYYVLGYTSTNRAQDGKFRRINVRVRRPNAKLEYRSGYYAPRDFAHAGKDDREQQLQEQLASDLSFTDLSAYVTTGYFRIADNRYFVPLSLIVPGYQLPISRTTDKNKASVDILGLVTDQQKRPVGRIRDTVRLSPEAADELKRKVVQYETGLEMPAGKYHVKMVVRENQDGAMGAFETDINIPDIARASFKMSSVVLGTQLQPANRPNPRNPLVRNGRELLPNVTRVVSSGQHLYFYYEVYDPARAAAAQDNDRRPRVLTSIAFYRGGVRVFETPVVEATELGGTDKNTAVFQFDVPASSLQPGTYTCQVNIVDDVAGTFEFPRFPVIVRR